jgi:hypothetical protein
MTMGTVISYQLSVISYQLSVISYQLSVISYQLSVGGSNGRGDEPSERWTSKRDFVAGQESFLHRTTFLSAFLSYAASLRDRTSSTLNPFCGCTNRQIGRIADLIAHLLNGARWDTKVQQGLAHHLEPCLELGLYDLVDT